MLGTLTPALPTRIAAQSVVDYPDYGSHANYIEVNRVKADKAETVLEATVYNRPGYWVQMNSTGILIGSNTGKKYKFLRAEGLEMDKKVAMPSTGYRDFTIRFEAIDKRDSLVHWMGNDNDTLFTSLRVRPAAKPKGRIACRIKGEVKGNKPCARLLLAKVNEIPRISFPLSIPVRNNKFDYTYYTDTAEVRKIIKWEDWMNGSYMAYTLFIENGENEVRMPEGFDEWEMVSATTSNREWICRQKEMRDLMQAAGADALRKEMDAMSETDMYGPAAIAMFDQLHKLYEEKEKNGSTDEIDIKINKIYEQRAQMEEAGTLHTKGYTALTLRLDSINLSVHRQIMQKMNERPSLVGLYYLYETIERFIGEEQANYLQEYADYRNLYASEWGGHFIGQRIEAMVAAQLQMKPGQPYMDYTVEDLQGHPTSVAGLIKGKWALIDLWASWCGPCRTNSRQLIPLYHKYRDKGFTIVGIARETKKSDVINALKKERYPWTQLVELNDQNGIWLKHGLENAAGGTFLINPDGKIAAVNPPIDEIERYLLKTQ